MTEKANDWRIVTVILLIAAALRIVGITHGQPIPQYHPTTFPQQMLHQQALLHPDEFLFITRSLRMLVTGQLNPQFFENPSFLINLNFLTFAVTGAGDGIDQAERDGRSGRSYAPFHLYVIGRIYSALGGVVAVAAAYATARLLAGRYAGIVAGLLTAFAFPLVQHAHYATTSSLAAGFTMLAIWASLLSIRTDGRRRWVYFGLANIAVGLATGNRYNAGVVAIIVLILGLVYLYRQRDRNTLVSVLFGWLLFPLTFILTTPHVIFDTQKFLADIQYISNQYLSGREDITTLVSPETGLLMEWQYLIVFGVGVPAMICVPLGIYVLLKDARQRLFAMLIIIYLLLYSFLILRTVRPNGADQLLIPIIAPLILLAGVGLKILLHYTPLKNWCVRGAGALILIIIPAFLSLQFVFQRAQLDTRDYVQEWVYENLPDGSAVYLVGPYNVPLDEVLYDTQQDFADYLSVSEIQARGFDYVIVSDAHRRSNERFTQSNDPNFVQSLIEIERAYANAFQPIYSREQPGIMGAEWALHTASYWHNPGITVYCVTQQSCNEEGI